MANWHTIVLSLEGATNATTFCGQKSLKAGSTCGASRRILNIVNGHGMQCKPLKSTASFPAAPVIRASQTWTATKPHRMMYSKVSGWRKPSSIFSLFSPTMTWSHLTSGFLTLRPIPCPFVIAIRLFQWTQSQAFKGCRRKTWSLPSVTICKKATLQPQSGHRTQLRASTWHNYSSPSFKILPNGRVSVQKIKEKNL